MVLLVLVSWFNILCRHSSFRTIRLRHWQCVYFCLALTPFTVKGLSLKRLYFHRISLNLFIMFIQLSQVVNRITGVVVDRDSIFLPLLRQHMVNNNDLSLRLESCGARLSRNGLREWSREIFAVALIVIALVTTTSTAFASAGPGKQMKNITVNLNDVDIRTLIETVSRETGRNFIIDPRVKANVTVVSNEPVDVKGLYTLFLSVLEVHGYSAVTSGSFTKIVPMAVGVQSAVPVLPDRSVKAEELVTDVVSVQHVPVQELVEVLRPLLPPTATIGAEPASNAIVITDIASNTTRIREIIRELDLE